MKESWGEIPVDVLESSPIEGGVNIEDGRDTITGHYYYEKNLDPETLSRQNIPVERFVSLMGKGIFHISDIVTKDGKHYSRINSSHLENSKPARDGELEAEMFMLRYLFGDWDKDAAYSDALDTANVIIEKNNFAHFDYGEAFRNKDRDGLINFLFAKNENPQTFKPAINDLLDDPMLINGINASSQYRPSENDDSVRQIAQQEFIEKELFEKAVALGKAIAVTDNSAENPDFFKAIIKKAGLDLNNERFRFLVSNEEAGKIEELRTILSNRLAVLEETLLERHKFDVTNQA